MGMKFGIAAFLLALVAIVVPFYGIMVGWAALLLASFAAWTGERIIVYATIVVSIINYIFISPLLASAIAPIDNNLIEITMVMLAAPVVTIMVKKLLHLRQQ